MKNFIRIAKEGGYGPWWGIVIYALAYTVLLPVTLLVRLILFGRITDKETIYDKAKSKIEKFYI